MALTPELILCFGILAVFCTSLGESMFSKARNAALAVSILALLATVITLTENSVYFFNTYQVNLFSQMFKLFILFGLSATIIFGRELKDIQGKCQTGIPAFPPYGNTGTSGTRQQYRTRYTGGCAGAHIVLPLSPCCPAG